MKMRSSSVAHQFPDPMQRLRDENAELRARSDKLFFDFVDATLALGLVTGVFPPINDVMTKRAQALLDKRNAEWKAKGH